MSNQSMSSGDPYCQVHGFTPCGCYMYPLLSLRQPIISVVSQQNFPLCETCKKHVGTCICAGGSDPWSDHAKLTTQIYMDITKPMEQESVKKWADELREISQKAKREMPLEPRSLYIYMLERCKYESTGGHFVKIFYWKEELLLWSKQELEMAADLLREDNFTVDLEDVENDNIMVRISWLAII